MIYIPPRNGYTTSEAAGAISLTLSRLTIVSPLRLRLVRANLSPHCVVNYNLSLLPYRSLAPPITLVHGDGTLIVDPFH